MQSATVTELIGKGSRGMCILIKFIVCHHWHGCETWTLNDQSINRVNVAWNNSFRHIFSGLWREYVKPLQYFCQTLPISYFIDQRKLLFWRKLAVHNNNFLLSLSRLVQKPVLCHWHIPYCKYHTAIDSMVFLLQLVGIKSAVWAKFTETVWKVLICLYMLVYFLLVYWVYRYVCLHVLFYRSLLILYYICILMCSYCCLFGVLNLMMMMNNLVHVLQNGA